MDSVTTFLDRQGINVTVEGGEDLPADDCQDLRLQIEGEQTQDSFCNIIKLGRISRK